MKRTVVSIFTIALTMIPAYALVTSRQPAQSNCTLTVANSPAVRGIRLGMSLQQLLALFPASSKRREMGEALERAKAATGDEPVYLLFNPTSDGSSEQFAGIDSVSAGVYKGQVVDYNVSYVGPTWRTIDEWVERLAETLALPRAQGWTVGLNEHPNKKLMCRGVEIEAGVQGGGGSIRVKNTEYNKETEDRKEAVEERKRRQFKP